MGKKTQKFTFLYKRFTWLAFTFWLRGAPSSHLILTPRISKFIPYFASLLLGHYWISYTHLCQWRDQPARTNQLHINGLQSSDSTLGLCLGTFLSDSQSMAVISSSLHSVHLCSPLLSLVLRGEFWENLFCLWSVFSNLLMSIIRSEIVCIMCVLSVCVSECARTSHSISLVNFLSFCEDSTMLILENLRWLNWGYKFIAFIIKNIFIQYMKKYFANLKIKCYYK